MQEELRARVVVDAMGSFSPIANQSRQGLKPDSVVLMVGSCAEGLPECTAADLLYSFTPLNRQISQVINISYLLRSISGIQSCSLADRAQFLALLCKVSQGSS